MKFEIRPIEQGESTTCEAIMRSLPQWFGIESALVEYADNTELMETYIITSEDLAFGFITLKQHNRYSAEIHVMAIKDGFHRQGAGRALVAYAEGILRANGIEYLQVKTLGPSHPDKNYQMTRLFYEAIGFRPLEENLRIWDESNPCLILVKSLCA